MENEVPAGSEALWKWGWRAIFPYDGKWGRGQGRGANLRAGMGIREAVKNETSGHFRHALLTIVQCAENPAKYFAKVLYKSMKGLGTDDITLTRIIVTRTEIDMHYIKIEYFKKYHKTLNDAVHSDTLGHYRDFLLQLLGPNV
nr:annexin D5-like [Arachis hypogaea]